MADANGCQIYINKAHLSPTGLAIKKLDSRIKRIETQNVRGFKAKTISQWLEAWRLTSTTEIPVAWIIPETHVSSRGEAPELEAMCGCEQNRGRGYY